MRTTGDLRAEVRPQLRSRHGNLTIAGSRPADLRGRLKPNGGGGRVPDKPRLNTAALHIDSTHCSEKAVSGGDRASAGGISGEGSRGVDSGDPLGSRTLLGEWSPQQVRLAESDLPLAGGRQGNVRQRNCGAKECEVEEFWVGELGVEELGVGELDGRPLCRSHNRSLCRPGGIRGERRQSERSSERQGWWGEVAATG